jgi:hypothetical protein
VPGEEDGARELGRFPRSRRERLRPAVVGLPVGPRRRVAGPRREEVARLAHLSPAGRAHRAGRGASPLFARCWDDHEVIEHRTRTLRHDALGVRRMRVLPLVCPAFPHNGRNE